MGSAMVGYVCLLGANTNCLVRRSKFKVKVGGPIIGVLLAGGQARRMGGGDKCLVELGGKPLLAHAIERLRPQVDILLLNANGDPARFASFGLKVIADSVEGFAGPLAGILAGMEWAQAHQPGARFIDASVIVTVATDTPFFPLDLVARPRETATTRLPSPAPPRASITPSGCGRWHSSPICAGRSRRVAVRPQTLSMGTARSPFPSRPRGLALRSSIRSSTSTSLRISPAPKRC
jgi:molybdopterin-guanine dinucleotide biosynthesis protein A